MQQQPEEQNQQEEIDQKIMITVEKVGKNVEYLQDKFQSLIKNTDLHHLKEIEDLPLSQKIQKVDTLRKSAIALSENLANQLFELDQLVGSSEKVKLILILKILRNFILFFFD